MSTHRAAAAAAAVSLTAILLPAQTRQFDLYTYTAPSGYNVREEKQQLEIAKLDRVKRYFCQFLLQQSQPSLGSAQQDIDAEWNIVMAKMYQIKSPPVTRPVSLPGAPDSIVRTASTSTAGVPSLLSTLLVLRFPGRYIGVLFNSSHAEAASACQADVATLLGSIRLTATGTNPAPPPPPPPPPQQPAAAPSSSERIPTGNTPGLFPGSPGWLPSGTGLPIPDPAFVQGRPVGLWWQSATGSRGELKPVIHVFLDGGIRASSPRLGGPRLFDLQGQKQQAGATGVGTYAIENGSQFVQRYDGFENRGAYSTGSDSTGSYFKSGGAVFRPLAVAAPQSIAGNWRGFGIEYTFRPDGTFFYGGNAPANARAGRYRLDGYLIQILPDTGAAWIDRAGMSGPDMLVLGSTALFRVK